MKLNKLFLSGVVALGIGLTACNIDEEVPETNSGKGDVWVSFAIALPRASDTRAEASSVGNATAGDTYVGTSDEQKVNSVRIVLYDNDQVAYAFDLEITSDGTGNFTGDGIAEGTTSTSSGLFVTKAEKVVKKDYKVLVLLNPTNETKSATQKSNNISEFIQPANTNVTALTSPAFFMSNSQGLVDVAAAALKTTQSEAESNPIAVKVDRAVAKVFVGGVPTVEQGATFTDIHWTLDVTNKKTFWMRKLAQKVSGLNNFVPETIGDNSNRYDRYAEDPNFTGTTISSDDFNYIEGVVTEGLKDAGFDDNKGIYVLENTMDDASQMNSVTTRVILKGVYTPAGFPEGDWYSYKGFKMTKTQFNTFKNQVTDDDGELPGTPAGFKADIWALMQSGQDFEAESFSKNNLKFYKGGICYYPDIYIRHFDDSQSSNKMGYGRYGVVRNNIYKLTLKTISQPGEPVVVPPAEVPDDKEYSWVSFNVEVLPWLIRTQDVNL